MRIKQLRNERKITQQELADALDIERALIARYENSTRKPPIENLVKLADYFEVSIDYLLGRSNMNTMTVNKPAAQYTPAEDRLIATYRALDDWGRGSVDATLQREYERVRQSSLPQSANRKNHA